MRHVMTLAALLVLGACTWLGQDPCTRTASSELRSIDARIAAAQADADSSFRGRLFTNGNRDDFLCRRAGGDLVECASLPPGSAASGHDLTKYDPEARLAALRDQRRAVLHRMMACQESS